MGFADSSGPSLEALSPLGSVQCGMTQVLVGHTSHHQREIREAETFPTYHMHFISTRNCNLSYDLVYVCSTKGNLKRFDKTTWYICLHLPGPPPSIHPIGFRRARPTLYEQWMNRDIRAWTLTTPNNSIQRRMLDRENLGSMNFGETSAHRTKCAFSSMQDQEGISFGFTRTHIHNSNRVWRCESLYSFHSYTHIYSTKQSAHCQWDQTSNS